MAQTVLGIDPGTTVMGYGVIRQGQQLQAIQYGAIRLHRHKSHAFKLREIFTYVSELVEEFRPDEIALEAPFYGKNVQSMLKLGRAQGVIMAAALCREIAITEYAPRKVKQAITGYGHASKEQIAKTLVSLLNLQAFPALLDASDALAVAVCHAYQAQQDSAKRISWEQFVRAHPTRLRHPSS